MTRDELLTYCLAKPGAWEDQPWEDDLVSVIRRHSRNPNFDTTFSINVRGTLLTVQKALPLLNPGASVILAGSTSATSGTAAFGVYAASKAAIRSFARTWAVELADRGIRVNAIVPGPTDTEGLRGLAPDAAAADGLVRQLGNALPLSRPGLPEEVASAVLFLASGQSSFVTGSELFADGGEEQQ